MPVNPLTTRAIASPDVPEVNATASQPVEAWAQRQASLAKIVAGLQRGAQHPETLEKTIEGLNRLIADLSTERDALSARLEALEQPPVGLPQDMLERVAHWADPQTRRALRLTNQTFLQIVNRQVRGLGVRPSDHAEIHRREWVPKMAELPVIAKKFPHLERLDLSEYGTILTAPALQPLAGLPKLRALVIPQFRHHDSHTERNRALCSQLATLAQLERLTTPNPAAFQRHEDNFTLNDDLLSRLTPLKQIKELPALRLGTAQGLNALGSFPRLEEINLMVTQATDQKLESLAKGVSRLSPKSLTIEIECASVTPAGFLHLEQALREKSGTIGLKIFPLPHDFPAHVLRDFAASLSLQHHARGGVHLFLPQ